MKFATQSLSLICTLGALAPSAQAGLILADWVGPNGDIWHDAANWNPQVIPNNGGGNEYHALISTKFGSLVNLGSNATVSTLTVGADDHLHINNGRQLFISALDKAGGSINNAGVIEFGSTGSTTAIRPADGVVSLTGGGTIRMSDQTSNWIYRATADGSLVNVDNIIEGAGQLSWTSAPTPITNQHLIIANQTAPLTIQPGSALFTNEDTLRAEDGGTLELNAGTYVNAVGLIEARAGSVVRLDGNAFITGGTLDTEGDGLLRVTSNTPHVDNLTHAGHTIIDNGRTLHASGSLHNTGLIELDSTGSTTAIRPADGVVSLTGGGTIRMSDQTSNWIYRATADGSLVNVDNIIEGAGQLSWTSAPTPFTNQHLIIANQTAPLTIQPGSALFTNEGTLRAESGGTLELNAGTYDNTGGLIEARAGSLVRLDGSAFITGGTLGTEDDGLFRVTTSTPQIGDLTHAGHTIIDNGRILLASGTLHNTGLIELDSAGSSTYLRPVDGELTLTGGGTIRLSDQTANWIYRHDAGSSVVNVDNVIEGSGNLGWSSSPTPFTNQHLVIANQTAPLTIQPGSALFTNEGTLRAEDGGTLELNAGTYDNTGGLIEARAGSLVELSGSAVITGGTLDTLDDGLFRVTNSTPHVDNLTHAGHTIINNGRTLLASGTITNTGTIEFGSTGSSTYLRPAGGPVTLTGGGTVLLADTSANWMSRWDAGSYWINQDNTVRGAGNLGWTSQRTGWINHGSIIADGVNLLDIAPDSDIGFVNHGLLHAEGSGGARINGGMMDQMGTVLIDAGSSLTRTSGHYIQTAGTTIVEGALAVTGSGNQLQLQGGTLTGNGQINGVVNNTGGDVNPGASAGLLTVSGTYLQNGSGVLTVEIDGDTPVTEHDVLDVLGEAQLGGVLQPAFNEALAPDVGDQWTVLTADFRAGTFNAVAPCEAIRVIYNDNSVVVEYTGVVKFADLNCDGVVDVLDMLIVIGAWGACGDAGPCPADLNSDSVVNVIDLLDLMSNWG